MLPVHLQRPNTTESVLVMKGNMLPMGVFYTTVSIGTPPQAFQVTVDTGSTDMLLPVAGCAGCKKGATLYDLKSSSSSSTVACKNTTELSCMSCSANHPGQCGFEDSYLTCDLSNLTASCTVRG